MAVVLTDDLIRGARGLLGWTQRELEEQSGVTQQEISQFERGNRLLTAKASAKLRSAFERAGVQFIAANVDDSELVGTGLRWRPPTGGIDVKII